MKIVRQMLPSAYMAEASDFSQACHELSFMLAQPARCLLDLAPGDSKPHGVTALEQNLGFNRFVQDMLH